MQIMFFANWDNPDETTKDKYQRYQVPVIQIDMPTNKALIVFRKALKVVDLANIAFERFE